MQGGCLCGRVRYAVRGPVLGQAVCHCRNCQRQTGTAFSVLVAVPREALALTGELSAYRDTADSGADVDRRFCGGCGSPIYSALPASPDVIFLKAGTLDDPKVLDPKVHVWCDSAWPSTIIPETAIRFPQNPPTS